MEGCDISGFFQFSHVAPKVVINQKKGLAKIFVQDK
jgi:hypothetical protein